MGKPRVDEIANRVREGASLFGLDTCVDDIKQRNGFTAAIAPCSKANQRGSFVVGNMSVLRAV
ncbi:MAG: hypothetical protein K1X78_20370 [Verrucomicrobiaceae bacterium]|nr:hypothetical protein [Verrucomicrobiaceae bacterium]